MGLFVERQPSESMHSVVRGLLAQTPDDTAAVEALVPSAAADAQRAASEAPTVLKTSRIVAGVAVAAVLIGVGILLVFLGDQQAIQQAADAAANPAYKAPALGIGTAGTTLITLGGAWSAALIGVILSEK